MIKKNTKLIILLVLSALFFVASFFLSEENRKTNIYSLDVEYIENKLHENESYLEKTVSAIKTKLSLLKNNTQHSKEWFFKNIEVLEEEKITILIYKNKSLLFWTNNNSTFPKDLTTKSLESKKIIKLQNGWYDIYKQSIDSFVIVGLLKIKNNYYFDNEYLSSKFLDDLNISPSVILSTTHTSIGKDILNKDGNYLFSLIPPRNITNNNGNKHFPFVLFYFSVGFFLLASNNLLSKTCSKKKPIVFGGILTIISSAFVLFVFYITSHTFLESSILFAENVFEKSYPFYTLGGLLMQALIVVFLSLNLFKIIPAEYLLERYVFPNKLLTYSVTTIYIIINFLFFLYLSNIESFFVKNTLVFTNFSNIINALSIYAYFAFGMFFLSVIYLLDLFFKLISRAQYSKTLILPIFVSIFLIILIHITNLIQISIVQLSFYIILIGLLYFLRVINQKYSYFHLILTIFIFTLFFILFEEGLEQEREQIVQKKLIENLANERDDIAEQFLREIDNRLFIDTVLKSKIVNISEKQDAKIIEYLRKKYFYGFWGKYDLSVSLCGNSSFYNSENQALNCQGYYSNKFNEFGTKVNNTIFWFINDNSGKITYTGLIKIPNYEDSRNLQLYISLYEKLTSKSLGYPKLLIDKSSLNNSKYESYSYAKYLEGKLIVRHGKYSYDLNNTDFLKNSNTPLKKNGYTHRIFLNIPEQQIILSKKTTSKYDLIISFAYLFVFFNVIVFVLVILTDYRFVFKKIRFNFTNQIRFAMIFILLISFILFGAGTIYFTIKQDETFKNKEIADKIQSVLVELKHKLQTENELSPAWHTDKYWHLDDLLIKFSKVFFSDINLYDLEGSLLATSRAEIFNKGLIGKQMNAKAFKMMTVIKKTEFIHKEKIGDLEFLSIYIPLENENNKVIAYINLPYFTKGNNLQNSISTVFFATLNLYLVLFLIAIFIAFVISSAISRPLRMLQSKFKAVQLGKKHQEINYTKKDEIGELVKEYNLMVSKLEFSAKKLAESERESAWREMAKQIAHEIKNPLTPMKLSIQFLQKAWTDKIDDNTESFEKRLNSVAETLIEQINTLSAIASEFSAFAKMPKTRKEQVDIVQKLKTVTSLFENTKNINLSLNLNNIKKLNIVADKEQVSRVFINLIKNAIQAIPEDRDGIIKITLTASETKAKITIQDNGKGISDDKKERLFEPTFTTKTIGTGVGLAIVKNIVNSVDGEIWFDTKVNVGTSFYVELKRFL